MLQRKSFSGKSFRGEEMGLSLAVVSCSKCKFLTDERRIVSQVEQALAVPCPECAAEILSCDHPSGSWDKKRQTFVCSWCGEDESRSTSTLRQGLKEHLPELARELPVDITNH